MGSSSAPEEAKPLAKAPKAPEVLEAEDVVLGDETSLATSTGIGKRALSRPAGAPSSGGV